MTLPLGKYHIVETKPPYGYVGTDKSYDVTFTWEHQKQEVIVDTDPKEFVNEREKARVGVYKIDKETGKYLAGAIFNLYTADDIYNADGKLIFAAGDLVATSPATVDNGYTYFAQDIRLCKQSRVPNRPYSRCCFMVCPRNRNTVYGLMP